MEDKQKWSDLYVNWKTFIWAIGLLSMFVLFSCGLAATAQNVASENRADIKVQDNKYESIIKSIETLSGKFDKITEIRVIQ